jgi:hypothetical protein
MDQQGRPNEPQLVYRRDPKSGRAGGRASVWGLIPHFCEQRPDFAPIHARDAYRKRRCVDEQLFSEEFERVAVCDFPP